MLIYYLLLLLTSFWNYPRLPKFGDTWTVVKIVGLAAVAAAVVKHVLGGREVRLFARAEARLFFLLFAIAAISAATASGEGWWAAPMQTYLSVAAFLYVTLVFVDSPLHLERACYVVLFSMLLASYSVFSQYVKYGVVRPGGIFGDPNYFGMVATSMLPLVWFLHPAASLTKKVFLGITGVALVAATLLGASRGGLIALGFCLLYMLFHSRRKVLLIGAGTVALALLVWSLPQTGLDRFRTLDSGTRVSTETRKELLKAGWEMIKARPLGGVGLGMYKPLAPQFNPGLVQGRIGHNTYVEVAAELGVPACIVFALLLGWSWRRATNMSKFFDKRGEPVPAQIARALEIGIATYSVGALFLSAEYVKHLWILIWFVLALARVAQDRQEPLDTPEVAIEEPDGQCGESDFATAGP